MNRREFILGMAVSGLTMNEGVRFLLKQKNKDIRKNIHNLGDHIYTASYSATLGAQSATIKGMGVVVGGYYISMAHIPDFLNHQIIKTPMGFMKIKVNSKNKKYKIGDNKLETLVEDYKTDMFIAKPNNPILDFPCPPSREVDYGDEIYLIGNPKMSGLNIRRGFISDLDGFGNVLGEFDCVFGIDFPLHKGDSGCPVVNKDFELVGLAKYVYADKFGYISRIGPYLNKINSAKKSQ